MKYPCALALYNCFNGLTLVKTKPAIKGQHFRKKKWSYKDFKGNRINSSLVLESFVFYFLFQDVIARRLRLAFLDYDAAVQVTPRVIKILAKVGIVIFIFFALRTSTK